MNTTIKLILGIIILGGISTGIYYYHSTSQTVHIIQTHSGQHTMQDDTMKLHCQTMPDMPGCEAYTTSGSIHHSGHTMNHADMIQSEFDFITLMIPHHQEAVDTSKSLLVTTTNPTLTKLTQTIINTQTKEIEMMKQRISQHYSGISYNGMPYMPMMKDTSGLTGVQIDIQRTKDMIAHHQGAVDMAKKVLKIMDMKDQLIKFTGTQLEFRNSLRTFANDIITTQTKEIKEMNTILKQ